MRPARYYDDKEQSTVEVSGYSHYRRRQRYRRSSRSNESRRTAANVEDGKSSSDEISVALCPPPSLNIVNMHSVIVYPVISDPLAAKMQDMLDFVAVWKILGPIACLLWVVFLAEISREAQ